MGNNQDPANYDGLIALFTFWALADTIQAVFCFYQYGWKRVFKLQERGFHFPMYVMLQLCGLFDVCADII